MGLVQPRLRDLPELYCPKKNSSRKNCTVRFVLFHKIGCWLFGENKQKGDIKCFKVGALPSQHNKAHQFITHISEKCK